jgi:HEPN domain-containing protein
MEQEKPQLHDLACFHCQQSAEKYLKALLQERGLEAPRTHDLVRLLDLLTPHDTPLDGLRRRLNSLNAYAVEIRYPIRRANQRKAQTAIRHAEEVRREIRARLGLSP